MKVAQGLLVLAGIAASVAACDTNGTPCYPGDIRPCDCAGTAGFSTCDSTGAGYGSCSCNVDAATDAANVTDAGDAESGLPFGATCSADAQCASGICFIGGMRPFCSIKCTGPQDCPVPPTVGVCNNRGYCKAP